MHLGQCLHIGNITLKNNLHVLPRSPYSSQNFFLQLHINPAAYSFK